MSSARRAVRFFGTVHHQVHHFRAEEAKFRRGLFTPDRFPAFLAVTSVTGLVFGFQVMDRIQAAAVGRWQFSITGCSWTLNISILTTHNPFLLSSSSIAH